MLVSESWDNLSYLLLNYCISLSVSLSAIHSQVKAVLPTPADAPQHHFKPGDWVVIKDFRRSTGSSKGSREVACQATNTCIRGLYCSEGCVACVPFDIHVNKIQIQKKVLHMYFLSTHICFPFKTAAPANKTRFLCMDRCAFVCGFFETPLTVTRFVLVICSIYSQSDVSSITWHVTCLTLLSKATYILNTVDNPHRSNLGWSVLPRDTTTCWVHWCLNLCSPDPNTNALAHCATASPF